MIARLGIASVFFVASASSFCFAEAAIHFDLPATAMAKDVTPEAFAEEMRLVSMTLNLSLIVDSLPAPDVEQLVVQISPLGGNAIVADYSPRTELSSRYATEIEVCESKEVSDRVGFSIDGAYANLTRANIGADRGEKNVNSTKFSRVAPMHIVASSGTTHRGRGVYFKLRADDRQVLEGDKAFTVVLRVPKSWRGELIEVRVEAESMSKTFSSSLSSLAGIPAKSQVVGGAKFIVAAHLDGDHAMARLAHEVSEAELQMRDRANRSLRKAEHSKQSRIHHVSFRFDLSAPDPIVRRDAMARTLERVIFGNVDPYIDPSITNLALEIRVAILDYLAARKNYVANASREQTSVDEASNG